MINKKILRFMFVFCLVTGSIWYLDTHPVLLNKAVEAVTTIPPSKLPGLRLHWKNSGGDWCPEDFLTFENPAYEAVRNDTLFIRKKPVAVVDRVAWRISFDYEMEISSIPEGKKCWYVSKGGW
ncbi:MAG: hypothetical protein LUG98_00365 [Tannerellaceae bacterium]|nr:hypothetical protein [Tannerellaceae bacterium]